MGNGKRMWLATLCLTAGVAGCDGAGTDDQRLAQQGAAAGSACGVAAQVSQCSCPGGGTGFQNCLGGSMTWSVCACAGGAGQGTGGLDQGGTGAIGSGGSMFGGGGGGGLGGGGGGGSMLGGSGGVGAGSGGDGSGGAGGGGGGNGGSFGDGSGAVVTAPFACGASGGLGTTNVKIGGRDVLIEYPCDHREGADMVFILNLHGTMATENLKLYQHGYFSIHNHIASHNFIVAAPKAIGSQWGNEGGQADTDHLLDVIDYVYDTFKAFNIQGMWIGGHSWGSMYTRTFVCNAAFADRVKGAILMSGNSNPPDCSDRLSLIGTLAENDITPTNVQQAGVAASHGCGAMVTDMVGNNVHDVWPSCNPGFVHANYLMLGKEHATSMDAEVVAKIADEIRIAIP